MLWWRKKKQVEQLATPYGPITATTTKVASTPQAISPLSPDEIDHKAARVAESFELAKSLQIAPANHGLLSVDQLDELLVRWNPATTTDDEFNRVAEVIGFAFGEVLVRDFSMTWVVVNDEYGADFAVRHEATGCMAFPLSSVGKRLNQDRSNFLGPLAFAIQRQIRDLQRQ